MKDHIVPVRVLHIDGRPLCDIAMGFARVPAVGEEIEMAHVYLVARVRLCAAPHPWAAVIWVALEGVPMAVRESVGTTHLMWGNE